MASTASKQHITLSASEVMPRLKPMEWARDVGLGHGEFADSRAFVALSPELCAGFQQGQLTLTHSSLMTLGMSTRALWDRAAHNLIDAHYTRRGIPIDIRPSWHHTGQPTRGLQVRIGTAPVSAWLAHPATFELLDRHFRDLLGGDVYFYAPTEHLVFVHRDDEASNELDVWMFNNFAKYPHSLLLSANALRNVDGYPFARASLNSTAAA